jgi:hypothetical protein
VAEAFRTCIAGRNRENDCKVRGDGFSRAKDLDIRKDEAIGGRVTDTKEADVVQTENLSLVSSCMI